MFSFRKIGFFSSTMTKSKIAKTEDTREIVEEQIRHAKKLRYAAVQCLLHDFKMIQRMEDVLQIYYSGRYNMKITDKLLEDTKITEICMKVEKPYLDDSGVWYLRRSEAARIIHECNLNIRKLTEEITQDKGKSTESL